MHLRGLKKPRPIKKRKKKVFLGGTCNGSNWRDKVIKNLQLPYYNPVVEGEWTQKDYRREIKERNTCQYCVYVITPKLTGFYSIAELIDDCHDKSKTTIFCYLKKEGNDSFTKHQVKSLTAIGRMVKKRGGIWVKSLTELTNLIHQRHKNEKMI